MIRRRQRANTTFELGDEVLSVTSIVNGQNKVFSHRASVIGEIKEVEVGGKKLYVAFPTLQVCSQDDQMVWSRTCSGAILDLGNFLR